MLGSNIFADFGCREVYFGLERVLHGEDGAEGVSLKILETSPFTPGPPAMGLNGFGKVYW